MPTPPDEFLERAALSRLRILSEAFSQQLISTGRAHRARGRPARTSCRLR
jgi:hypothetical protein